MDLENELRQAMAEHVTDVSVSRTLAADAKRRHHRTVRRRTTIVVGAAALVVVGVAMVPAYQSFRPQTVGDDGKKDGGHSGRTTATPPSAPALTPQPHSGAPGSGSKGSHHSSKPTRPPGVQLPGLGTVTSVLGYLPAGVGPGKTCHTDHVGSKQTTSCRWSGSGGWVEVRLVRASGLKSPTDLGLAPPMAEKLTVHGHPALLSQLPSQVMWIERPGLGVWVGVSPSLSDSISRVADGVSVT